MEKMHTQRLFYALWPDASARAALQRLQISLPLSGRLVPADNLHLTLAFLGNQPEQRLPTLKRILAQLPCPAHQLKLSLQLDMAGYFRGSRITWLGMESPPPALMELQASLMQMLKEEGIVDTVGGKFTPHVSLARKSEPLPKLECAPLKWQSMQLVLVRSMLLADGSRYEVIACR